MEVLLLVFNPIVLQQMSSEQLELYCESVIDPLESSVSTHSTAVTFEP